MLTSELDFPLPPELIAQQPARPRSSARLLHLMRAKGSTPFRGCVAHRSILDLPDLLRKGDLLVFNDTRVLRARLHGKKPSGGRVEALLLREQSRNVWEALLKPSSRLKVGGEVYFHAPGDENNSIKTTLLERHEESWKLQFHPPDQKDIRDCLTDFGEIPIPPYIKTAPQEGEYQTVYAQTRAQNSMTQSDAGSALDSSAAPTAGLHFTPELLASLRERGVQTAFVTLGVGVGTFRPIQTQTLEEHAMHEEEFFVSRETASAINAQKQNGNRIVAVGTTTTRVLESIADANGMITEGAGHTSIFIKPGHHFRCVDALLTNFHLPRSTLIALVAAFVEDGLIRAENDRATTELTGLEIVRYAYGQAIAEKYRFFSFGDAMLIE